MEQQKLLWTILSVGILILILLGAGMFFFLPSDSTGLAQNGKTTEWTKAASPAPAAEQKTPDQKATAAPPQASKPEIKKTPVQPSPSPTPAPATKPEVKKTPVQPSTPAPTKQAQAPAPKATPAPATKPATTSTQQTKPAASNQPAAKPAQTPAAKPAATAAKASYWVQVGSYATKDAAEKTKQELNAKGYSSSIQSITANGKTYHRVKIGPYPTRADVDSLLPKIKALPGMGDSFITTK